MKACECCDNVNGPRKSCECCGKKVCWSCKNNLGDIDYKRRVELVHCRHDILSFAIVKVNFSKINERRIRCKF